MLEICDELQPRRVLFGRLVSSLENSQPESEHCNVVEGAAAALAYQNCSFSNHHHRHHHHYQHQHQHTRLTHRTSRLRLLPVIQPGRLGPIFFQVLRALGMQRWRALVWSAVKDTAPQHDVAWSM
jgi:hypothetical protein